MAKGTPGFFDVDERLAELSAKSDDLERVKALIDFEMFRAALEAAAPRADRSKGGRPPFDHVFMFKVLILQAMHALSDERCEYLIKDRLSFMRFLGLGLGDAVPDANTIWTFREALKTANAADVLFEQFDAALREAGYLAMSGQIVDATIVAAPKQRNTNSEKQAIKDGRIPEGWKDKPAKLAQKDRDARWTVKYTKAKVAGRRLRFRRSTSPSRPSDTRTMCRPTGRHGLIRKWTVTDAAAHDGARLEDLLDRANTASEVWADTAYRSAKNEAMLLRSGFVSRIHRKKPKGGDAGRTRVANGRSRQCAPRRACLRASEGADGPVRPNHRPRAGAAQDRARQSRLQHAPLRLAARARRTRVRNMSDGNGRRSSSKDAQNAARAYVTLREDVGPRHAALSTPENTVIGGVQLPDGGDEQPCFG